jgi:hypothetical protein
MSHLLVSHMRYCSLRSRPNLYSVERTQRVLVFAQLILNPDHFNGLLFVANILFMVMLLHHDLRFFFLDLVKNRFNFELYCLRFHIKVLRIFIRTLLSYGGCQALSLDIILLPMEVYLRPLLATTAPKCHILTIPVCKGSGLIKNLLCLMNMANNRRWVL